MGYRPLDIILLKCHVAKYNSLILLLKYKLCVSVILYSRFTYLYSRASKMTEDEQIRHALVFMYV